MIVRLALLVSLVALGTACGDRSNRQSGDTSSTPSARNEARNDVGRAPAAQGEAKDREVMRSIHEALSSDQTLSPSARNVTVKSENGVVTLSGQVQNEQEKSRVEQIVQQTTGVQKVDNELDVAS